MIDDDRDDATLEPAPLRADAARMLANWREAEAMPRAAKLRVGRAIEDVPQPSAPRPVAVWAWAVALAAAVLLLWWGAVRLQQSPREAHGSQAADVVTPQGPAVLDAPPDRPIPAELAPVIPSTAVVDGDASPSAGRAPPRTAVAPEDRPTDDAIDNAIGDANGDATGDATDDATDDVTGDAEARSLRERELVVEAWSALASGDPDTARRRAEEHRRTFPSGALGPERDAITVIAGCKLREPDAVARALAWIDAQPRSPLVGRVRTACLPTP